MAREGGGSRGSMAGGFLTRSPGLRVRSWVGRASGRAEPAPGVPGAATEAATDTHGWQS